MNKLTDDEIALLYERACGNEAFQAIARRMRLALPSGGLDAVVALAASHRQAVLDDCRLAGRPCRSTSWADWLPAARQSHPLRRHPQFAWHRVTRRAGFRWSLYMRAGLHRAFRSANPNASDGHLSTLVDQAFAKLARGVATPLRPA